MEYTEGKRMGGERLSPAPSSGSSPFVTRYSPQVEKSYRPMPILCPGRVLKGDAMPGNPNVRRMTLRQLLTSAEKCAHDLAEQLQTTMLSRVTDCRDLTRPVRRRSHYPTFVAVVNALNRLHQSDDEVEVLVDY